MKDDISGIYCIQNTINFKMYIGSAKDIKYRWKDHICNLLGNKHRNKHLQHAVNFYGLENFEFCIIEECDELTLERLENFYIIQYRTNEKEFGYNLTEGGRGTKGYKHSKETRAKMGRKSRGRAKTPEQRKKISESNKGKVFSDETKKKMAEAKIGKPSTRKGTTTSDEAKLKQSLSKTGKKTRKNAKSKYVGVGKKRNKWVAKIYVNGKGFHLGVFDTEEDAARAYNEAALKYFGENARLNIIQGE
jgi:group I intron endonuclease